MAGVSETTGPVEMPELQSIMEGGQNWMQRMTAFLQAKEQATTALQDAAIAGDILSVRDEARADREAAAKELADARQSADALAAFTQTQADALMAKAKADADKIMADANALLETAKADAQVASEAAGQKTIEADSIMALAVKRRADLDGIERALSARAEALTASEADAAAAKAKYDALTEKLKGFLAELAGE